MTSKIIDFLHAFSSPFGNPFSQMEISQSFYLRLAKPFQELGLNPQGSDECLFRILNAGISQEGFDLFPGAFCKFDYF